MDNYDRRTPEDEGGNLHVKTLCNNSHRASVGHHNPLVFTNCPLRGSHRVAIDAARLDLGVPATLDGVVGAAHQRRHRAPVSTLPAAKSM